MEKAKTNLKKYLYLLKVLVFRDIRNQYAGSFLGALWTVLNPLLNMIVMAIVFINIFGSSSITLDYPVYVLAGNIIFNLFRSGSEGALTSVVDQRDLLSKTKVPLYIIPMSRVGSSIVSFLFSYVALIIVMLIRIPAGVTFHWSMLLALILLPSLILFTLGFSFLLSSFFVSFRDIKHFYSVILTLWMYLTPLFYSIESLNLSPLMNNILKINPMFHFVLYFRETLMGITNDWQTLLLCYSWGIAIFGIGYLVFDVRKNKLLLEA
ncbi:MAG: ABC transporter permease [Bacilli bacterium]|nr:ABC transporter permease [Bacilli bacterium]